MASYDWDDALGNDTVSWYREMNNPYGEVILMVIRLISPYGETVLSCTDMTLPFFEIVSLYADIISPCADAFSAYGDNASLCAETSSPYAEMTFPYADVIQMDGSCVPSCDGVMSTHDDVILPYAEATLPFADVAFPFGSGVGIVPEISFQQVDGIHLIRVHIHRGSNFPYYLKSKGKREGTYIRVGSSNHLADENIIAELERQKRNVSYDSEIVLDHSRPYPSAVFSICQD